MKSANIFNVVVFETTLLSIMSYKSWITFSWDNLDGLTAGKCSYLPKLRNINFLNRKRIKEKNLVFGITFKLNLI